MVAMAEFNMLNKTLRGFFALCILAIWMPATDAGETSLVDRIDEVDGELELFTLIVADRKDGYTGNIIFEKSLSPFFGLGCYDGSLQARFIFQTRLLGGIDILGNHLSDVKLLVKFNDEELLRYENVPASGKDGDRVSVTSIDEWLPHILNLKKMAVRSYSYWEEREITFFIDDVPPEWSGYVERVIEGCGY